MCYKLTKEFINLNMCKYRHISSNHHDISPLIPKTTCMKSLSCLSELLNIMLKCLMHHYKKHSWNPLVEVLNYNFLFQKDVQAFLNKMLKMEFKTKSPFEWAMGVYLYKIRWLFTLYDISTSLMTLHLLYDFSFLYDLYS